MTTTPGFSSRSTDTHVQQFPHRDEADMNEYEPDPGFSNSAPVKGAPEDVYPDIQEAPAVVPGFSNAESAEGAAESSSVSNHRNVSGAPVEATGPAEGTDLEPGHSAGKAVDAGDTESKVVTQAENKAKAPAKKAPAKKAAAKTEKKG